MFWKKASIVFMSFGLMSCSSMLKTDIPMEDIQKNDEFEQMVKVKTVATPAANVSKAKPKVKPTKPKKIISKKKKTPLKKVKKTPAKVVHKKMPKFEDSSGFNGRRPIKDPFRVGEKIVLDLDYLKMNAGQLIFEVLPFVEVNGRISYTFKVSIKSSSIFAYIYKMNNFAETYVDYETMLPSSHSVHIKESKQIKEARSFFNWKDLSASYWEKRITDDGEENKKKSWKLKPYSQNLISTLYYLRAFQLEPGKSINYRVADAGKQHMVQIDVLKREVIKNDVGTFNTVKVKVQYKTDGTFSQAGDIYFWITDDDRKLMVKLVSKIKIGSIHGDLVELRK